MKTILAIMLSAMLTDNFVLSKFMGICPFLGVSKKLDSAAGMGVAVTFVMICATIVTYPIHHEILVPNGLEYFDTVVFILVIALFVQLVENFLKKCVPSLYSSLGVYLPLITTNCAVLGVTVLNIDNNYTFFQSIINALFGGLGFMIVLVIFSGVRKKLEYADIPETFKGVPATLIAASIVSISFMGFAGLIK
ncbi:electron transport complex protein RnfA [Ruminococcus flavefaciens]|uniref:Ion-translocating oxidoreductase complex subunit A n=1 Tax=Ruminococcus flavefaciens TaxID=1265 RepID=A0A1K1LTU5_RUMFL|nr:RnfABCDGE type electron transport complex subunit A [Ruminococcus flavefaciens]SFW14264.1 electron transport complex protein RnfA [Ruminococcus flavefaciens]